MVVEFLTFDVDPGEREEWMAVEQRVWSAALAQVPGFVRKEMWLSADDERAVHAVIWWADQRSWDAVDSAEVAAIDERMGRWLRTPTMRSFRVLREG